MHYSIEKTALITFLKGRQPAPRRVSFQWKESKTAKNLHKPGEYTNLVQEWFAASQSGTALDQIQKGRKDTPFELRTLLL